MGCAKHCDTKIINIYMGIEFDKKDHSEINDKQSQIALDYIKARRFEASGF